MSEPTRKLFGWWDHFYERPYRTVEEAKVGEAEGNHLTALYYFPAESELPHPSDVAPQDFDAQMARLNATVERLNGELAAAKQGNKSGSVPAALALLAEWIDTEMDPEDDEYAPWMENFTARVRAALEGHKSGGGISPDTAELVLTTMRNVADYLEANMDSAPEDDECDWLRTPIMALRTAIARFEPPKSGDAQDAARWRWWCKWWFDEKDDMEKINDLEYEDQATLNAAVDSEIASESHKPGSLE